MNYNMNNFKTVASCAEQNLSKGVPILVIQRVKGKGKAKGKGKQACVTPKLDAGATK